MTRRVRVAWLALMLAVACAAALWMLPARWVMAWIPESSPVIVTDAAGTMWSASATVAVGVGGLRRTLPDPLEWRLAFAGGPHLLVNHPWLRGPVRLAPSWRGLRISSQSLQLPAVALTTVHAMFNTLDPGGEVLINWPELNLGMNTISASAGLQLLSAQWRNASSALSRVRPMGDYTLVLNSTDDRDIALALRTNQGPLMMEGAGKLAPSGQGQLDGKAWVDDSASGDTHAALQALLNAMGPRSGPSGHVIMKVR